MEDAFRYEVTVSIGSVADLAEAEVERVRTRIENAALGSLAAGTSVTAVHDGRRAVHLVLDVARELAPADQTTLASTLQDSVVDVLEAGEGVQVGRFVLSNPASDPVVPPSA